VSKAFPGTEFDARHDLLIATAIGLIT